MYNQIRLEKGPNFNEVYYQGHFVGIILDKRDGEHKALPCVDGPNKSSKSLFECVLHLLNVDYLNEHNNS